MPVNEWVGRELDGRYVIEHVLGEGGMGVVLRAKHKFTGVPVAIKILRSELQLDADMQARFLAEAQAPNTIGHPGIVKVLDAGRSQEGQLYMVMELLTGRALRVAVARRELDAARIHQVIGQLLVVLGHAHAKGFVHRDLKPDNVFLCAPDDTVKLLDFGIAKMLASSGRTEAGVVLGTPAYMAPEQLADARNVDARADLWAVGVMLYEMVTGRLPIPGRSPVEMIAALAAHRLIPIRQLLPSVSPELEAFFARALAVDPRLRFGAAVEVAQALSAVALPIASAAPTAPAAIAAGSAAASSPEGAYATAASVAPRPPQTPDAFVPPPVAAPASSSRRGLWIGGVVTGVAVLSIGIVAATQRGASRPGSGASGDRPSVRDASADPVEVDTVVTSPSIDAPTARDFRSCEDKCSELMTRCETRLGSCVDDCLLHQAAFDTCFDRSMRDCTDGATCGFATICGGRVPNGAVSCHVVAQCQAGCLRTATGAYLTDCLCKCDHELDPAQTLTLAQLNACVLRCNGNQSCVERSCAAYLAACR